MVNPAQVCGGGLHPEVEVALGVVQLHLGQAPASFVGQLSQGVPSDADRLQVGHVRHLHIER
jgi:hypothetical protein